MLLLFLMSLLYATEPVGEPEVFPAIQPIRPDDPLLGPEGARFQMVVWSDIECPFCARIFPQLVERVRAATDLSLRYKHYPLNAECNPDMGSSYHVHACRAAALTSCAGAMGRFYELAPVLFAEPGLDGRRLKRAERRAGLDVQAMEACVASGAPTQDIRQDVEDARAVDLTGTPTLILKDGAGPWVKIRGVEALDALLAERRAR